MATEFEANRKSKSLVHAISIIAAVLVAVNVHNVIGFIVVFIITMSLVEAVLGALF